MRLYDWETDQWLWLTESKEQVSMVDNYGTLSLCRQEDVVESKSIYIAVKDNIYPMFFSFHKNQVERWIEDLPEYSRIRFKVERYCRVNQ